MKRNTGRGLNIAATLGRNDLPHRDGVREDPELRREPGSEAALTAEQVHARTASKGRDADVVSAGHEADISSSDYKPQEQNIEGVENQSDDNDPMDLGTMIRVARIRLGMRQVDLARRLRVKQSAISQWESGKFTPDVDNRIALAAELHLALQDLMPEAGNIPGNALNDPLTRRVVDNLWRVDPQTRGMIDVLLLRLREWHEQGHPDDRAPPLPPIRGRRRRR